MLKILVADDHEVVRKGLMKVLAEGLQPIKVEEARNGQEAVNKVWKSEYDLVVLDIKMPGKNGLARNTSVARSPRSWRVNWIATRKSPSTRFFRIANTRCCS